MEEGDHEILDGRTGFDSLGRGCVHELPRSTLTDHVNVWTERVTARGSPPAVERRRWFWHAMHGTAGDHTPAATILAAFKVLPIILPGQKKKRDAIIMLDYGSSATYWKMQPGFL